MAKNLLIVESPAKAKTINKYLGTDFEVLASYGHVRDLVPKNGAVDPDQDFAMQYELVARNKKHVDAIRKAAKQAQAIYLATDLDREGEAISWHIQEILKNKGVLKDKAVHRVVFNEITPAAIREAVAHPRQLSMSLVDAQQARRALDYLVGFNLSPLLWKKVRRGLSAGRVQSPALRLIVEREEEIEAFKPREYWTIIAQLKAADASFAAKLTRFDGAKISQFSFTDSTTAMAARARLLEAAGDALQVDKITRKQRQRRPAPPFITSTLQQEASRKLGFSTKKTMLVAQQLYEGVAIDGDMLGLITYMRTDSVSLAADAVQDLRAAIQARFGDEYLPEQPKLYKTKSKNAQEAHEAIRPVSAQRTPQQMAAFLDRDQSRLYDLIWKRTVACQMNNALIDGVSVELGCANVPEHGFRATGSTVAFAGFLAAYEEGRDQSAAEDDEQGRLPPLEQGQRTPVDDIKADQHFTEPPPRYTEASLVKTLEEHGIGRPSTYASIISTLLGREYVELERKRFTPTDVGRVVSGFLAKHFTRYVDYDFTARLEDELDAVSRGEKTWIPLLQQFWQPFKQRLQEKENVSRAEATAARELGTDPESGRSVTVRLGRYGPYVQIGTREDEDKPRFAGLRPGQKMDSIELDKALTLFDLPRELGETPEGEPVSANIGRFGPYVRYGKKFASIKEHDPYSITLKEALTVIAEKKQAEASRVIQTFSEAGIEVLNGRYGPYVTDGKRNASIPKDEDAAGVTLERAKEILETAPKKGRRRGGARKKTQTAKSGA